MSSLVRQADPLRLIAERLAQPSLRDEVAKPGINEGLRVTVHYHDGRLPDSVASLWRGFGVDCRLRVVYEHYDTARQPYTYHFTIPMARYQSVLAALRQIKFDELDDMTDLPAFGADTWLIERASGRFYHDVVLSPVGAIGHHREVIVALRQHLPEMLRELVI